MIPFNKNYLSGLLIKLRVDSLSSAKRHRLYSEAIFPQPFKNRKTTGSFLTHLPKNVTSLSVLPDFTEGWNSGDERNKNKNSETDYLFSYSNYPCIIRGVGSLNAESRLACVTRVCELISCFSFFCMALPTYTKKERNQIHAFAFRLAMNHSWESNRLFYFESRLICEGFVFLCSRRQRIHSFLFTKRLKTSLETYFQHLGCVCLFAVFINHSKKQILLKINGNKSWSRTQKHWFRAASCVWSMHSCSALLIQDKDYLIKIYKMQY